MGFKPVLDIVGTQNRFPSTKYDAGSVVLVGSFVACEMFCRCCFICCAMWMENIWSEAPAGPLPGRDGSQ